MTENFFEAIVCAANPTIGLAVVKRRNEASASAISPYLAILPRTSAPNGVGVTSCPPPGTNVLCLSMAPLDDHLCYLITNLAGECANSSVFGQSLFYNMEDYSELSIKQDTTSRAIKSLISDASEFMFNGRNGADADALPGDYDITDVTGLVGLHIGKLVAQLRGSPLAYIDMSSITHKVRIIGNTVEISTLSGERVLGKALEVVNIAADLEESLGVTDSDLPAYSIRKDGTLVRSSGTIEGVPLFREQRVSGSAVEGSECIIQRPAENGSINNSKEPPVTLYRNRLNYAGERIEASAAGISSIKTPDIACLEQYNYADSSDSTTTLRASNTLDTDAYTAANSYEPTETEYVDDAAHHKLDAVSRDYTIYMCTKAAESGLHVRFDTQEVDTTAAGPTSDANYGLPSSVVITDIKTGKETRYYNTASFISQEPDGSILICDGSGSEIRMTRGNIYIAAALDIFLRPGRSLIAMAPERMVLNTQKDLTINAADIYQRSLTSMHLAVTAENGKLVLESHNDKQNGQLQIISDKTIDMLGDTISIATGHITGAGEAAKRDYVSGNILINAGTAGNMYMQSGSCTLDTVTASILAFNSSGSGNCGGIIIANSGITASCAGVITLDGTSVSLGAAGAGSYKRFGGTIAATMASHKEINLVIKGSVLSAGAIKSDDSVIASNNILSGGSMACGSGEVGKLSDTQQLRKAAVTDDYFVSLNGDNNNIIQSLLTISTGMSESFKSFKFLLSKDYIAGCLDYKFPEMVWQARTSSKAAGYTWKEIPVGDTYCWPGEAVWSLDNVVKKHYTNDEASSTTGYIINTTK